MRDELGDRMKGNYEDRTRYLLPRRTYTIVRIDGKAFHTYTRHCTKPFDNNLRADLDHAVQKILPHMQGSVFAYTQSDEISVLMTDFAEQGTQAWFDGNIQKIVSVSASLMTAEFNRLRLMRYLQPGWTVEQFTLAHFDARVFTIPEYWEVYNYFVWRNKDAYRNAISMICHEKFGHKAVQGKSTTEKIEMLANAGMSHLDAGQGNVYGNIVTPTRICPAWMFTQDPTKLQAAIPGFKTE